ncbi:hypothetical protein [Stutzerimonas stutzeri]|uniref:Uncharacterized protein n=1 Tax=Stutzerimonas stutzeri TaxID=316 RepID=A0A0D9ARR3_STUST|nr:hypothetical protein [Stutzerimonas stutzeri]KJH82091.1 hypothetical protein UF78_10855 [Stutzerimonas stutzeri]
MTKKLIGISRHPNTATVLRIADLAAKVGVHIASAGSPIADTLYEFSKTGVGKVRDYVHARDDRRILEFHQHLLYRDEVSEEDILDGELEEANFHALMHACLSDIEDEKTIPYALLTRTIALGKIKPELRRHNILALKDIAWDHLDFLRKLYVVSKYAIIPKQGPGSVTAESILTGYVPGSIEHLAVVSLTSKGFIDGVQLSDLGKEFVKACSSSDDLTPGAYELQVWSDSKCDIILLDQSDSSMRFVELIQSALRAKGIGCGSGTAMEGALKRREASLFTNCAIVIFRRGKRLEAELQENLQHRVGTKPLVQLLIDSDGVETPEQLVSGEILVINSGNEKRGATLAVEKLATQIYKQESSRVS